jgi:MFS superfamily sulfate permease-like transporter
VRQDLAAGLALAAVALPSQLGTAHLAGFPPTAGLVAFAAGSVGFAAFGANRFVVACADTIAGKLGESNPVSLLLGLAVFEVTVLAERLKPRIPGALLGIMAAMIAVYWFGL